MSLPDDESVKKVKNDSDVQERERRLAKRSLYRKQADKKEESDTEPGVNINTFSSNSSEPVCISAVLSAIKKMETKMNNQFDAIRKNNDSVIKQLQEEIGKVRSEFNNRFEGLTKKVETRVSETFTKKVKEKMSKLSKDITDRHRKLQDKVNSVSDNLKKWRKELFQGSMKRLGMR